MVTAKEVHSSFQHKQYLFHRVFKLFKEFFHVYDENGNLIFYSRLKINKLRAGFRIYSDKSQTEELLNIKDITSKVMSIGPRIYAVNDSTTNEVVGFIKQETWKSIIKSEWIFFSNEGREIGKLTENSTARTYFHRIIALINIFLSILPINLNLKKYTIISIEGREIAKIKQNSAPSYECKYSLTINEVDPLIDRRSLIAAGVLLLAGPEGR